MAICTPNLFKLFSLATVVSVNLSARQFQQEDMVEKILHALKETGLEPHLLELEITEGTAMRNVETTVAKLNSLKRLGVQIAIDSLGTGYSSLSYLKKFPIDSLKIDRSFVGEVTTDPRWGNCNCDYRHG